MTYKLKSDPDNDGTYEYEYILELISNLDHKIKENATTMPMPGVSAEENIIMALEGETQEFTISFLIYNNGSKLGNTTITDRLNNDSNLPDDDVVTVNEQIYYLQDYIKDPSLGTQQALTAGIHVDRQVKITNMSFRRISEQPLRVTCDITMRVGGVV